MTTLPDEKPDDPDIFFKRAVDISVTFAQKFKWGRDTDLEDLTTMPWVLWTYDYLFQSTRIPISDLYPLTYHCEFCNKAKSFDPGMSPTCEICSTCFQHQMYECDDIACRDADAFKDATNNFIGSTSSAEKAVSFTFGGIAEILGPDVVFKTRVGIVVSRIGKRGELEKLNHLTEYGRLKQEQKDRILEFASSIVVTSRPALLRDGTQTHFIADGYDADSTIYFVVGNVSDQAFAAFMSPNKVEHIHADYSFLNDQ